MRLILAQGMNFSISVDLVDPLEKALRQDFGHYRVDKIELVSPFYTPGHFLFEPAGSLSRAQLPGPGAARREEGRASVLDTPVATLFASGNYDPAFLDAVLRHAWDGSEDPAPSPGASRREAALWSVESGGRRLDGASLEPGSPGQWSRTVALRYLLHTSSGAVAVTVAGKPLGGPGRIGPVLRRRLSGDSTPALLVNTGQVGISGELGLPKDQLLKIIGEHGFSVLAFQPHDAAHGWEEMVALSTTAGVKLLATNLAGETTAQALPFETEHIAEIGGVRVGLLSLLSPTHEAMIREGAGPYRVEDPAAAAQRAVRRLKHELKADVVALVSHLKSEEQARVLDVASDIDVVIDDVVRAVASRRKVTVELSGWSREGHDRPALRAAVPAFGFSEFALELRPAERGLELSRLEETPWDFGPRDEEAPELAGFSEGILSYFLRDPDPLLPDPRRIWPDGGKKIQYDPLEFWNLAAQALREESGAEVALLRVSRLGSNVTGELSESYPREWLAGSSPVRLVRLPGRVLRALLAKVPPDPPPILDGCCGPPRRYEQELWLATAGLERPGRVSGVPLSDRELYTVALTENLLSRPELPQLAEAGEPRPFGKSLLETVMGRLRLRRRSLSREAFEAEVRRGCEGKTPVGLVWRVNLRELSLQLADTQVDSGAAFSQVRDARAQATSQLYAAGRAMLYSELYWNRWRWDTGATADYGRVTIKPRGAKELVNETQDRFVLETELRHRTWSLSRKSSRPSAGPFFSVAYDTEFTRPEDRSKREFVRYKTGLKLFDGPVIKELYAGALAESDYASGSAGSRYGLAAGLSLEAAVPGTPIVAKSDAAYVEFERSRRDTAADLKRRLDVSARLSVPLWGGLQVSPYASCFFFEGAVVRSAGRNILLGVSLDFSRLWKPFY